MGVMESKPPISDGKKNSQTADEPEALGTILATIGDTTWRMFVPSIGFTLLGVWADTRILTFTGESATKPWFMVAGIIIGCLGAVLLVKKQLADIKTRKEPTK